MAKTPFLDDPKFWDDLLDSLLTPQGKQQLFEHAGPGPHPGTGTPQQVHAGGGAGGGKSYSGDARRTADIIKKYGRDSREAHEELAKFASLPDGARQAFMSEVNELAPISSGSAQTAGEHMGVAGSDESRNFYVPDINKDEDGDGIPDYSRVGVPANEVPTKVPRLPNLSPEERMVESLAISQFEAAPDSYAETYQQMLEFGASQSSDPNFGKTFNTDNAKDTLISYARGPNERAKFNYAVHQVSNAIAKRAFSKYLDEHAQPGGTVLVTAGGVSAGKGFALENNPAVQAVANQSVAIWDSAGEQNGIETDWVIKQAEARGMKVEVAFIDAGASAEAEPKNMGSPLYRCVKRAKKIGRMCDAQLIADSYEVGAKNMVSTMRKYGNDGEVKFHVIKPGPGGKGFDVSDKPPRVPNGNKIRENMVNFIRGGASAVFGGKVPEPVVSTALWHQRVWGITGNG